MAKRSVIAALSIAAFLIVFGISISGAGAPATTPGTRLQQVEQKLRTPSDRMKAVDDKVRQPSERMQEVEEKLADPALKKPEGEKTNGNGSTTR